MSAQAQSSEPATIAANSLAIGGEFIWPAPPYFEFILDNDRPDPEDCLLFFKDGGRSAGRLLRFLPDEALLEFQPSDGGANTTVAFSSLLRLRLLKPVRLRRQELPAEFVDDEASALSEHKSFRVDMVNGETFLGETRSSVNALCGVFLFPPTKEDSVLLYFVPAPAIRDYSLGNAGVRVPGAQHLALSPPAQAALKQQREIRAQKLVEYLTDNQIVRPDDLHGALKHQRARPIRRLAEALMELGLLTKTELDVALKTQSKNRKIPLGQILIDMGVVDAEVIKGVMAQKLGIPFVNLRKFKIVPDTLARLPAGIAHRHKMVPVCDWEGSLVVAIEDPMAMGILEKLRLSTGTKMVPVMASGEDINYALGLYYGPGNRLDALPGEQSEDESDGLAFYQTAGKATGIDELSQRLAAEIAEAKLTEDQIAESDSTLVQLVNKIILDAVQQKASDIHIESNPGRKNTRVRFRKDGSLVDYLELPSNFRSAMVSRIKIMCNLDITERRKPQDGKIDFSKFGPARVELRVATMPTTNGLEDVVMRLLAGSKPVLIDQLGFDADSLTALKRLMSRPHGLFLVCGPTGSGKTTTLHSLLGHLNTAEKKIWTAEDPIEITQAGLRQVQVNPKIGVTFAVAMRSFLRLDPDIVMVGEMRDVETTKIGIEASLTGHLVLSTLHTNSAPESIVRLLDLGMDPFNFADALLGILAQRLVKKLCPECKSASAATPAELTEMLEEFCSETTIDPAKQQALWLSRYGDASRKITLCRAVGCDACNGSGYLGRMGIYELLVADEAVKRLVQRRAPVAEVKIAAMAAGMRTLMQDGIDKTLQGLTEFRQVRAVCA